MSSSSSCNPFLPPPPFLHPSVKPHFVTLSSSSFREPKSTKKLTSNQYREPTTVATESRTKKKKINLEIRIKNTKNIETHHQPMCEMHISMLDVSGDNKGNQGTPGSRPPRCRRRGPGPRRWRRGVPGGSRRWIPPWPKGERGCPKWHS